MNFDFYIWFLGSSVLLGSVLFPLIESKTPYFAPSYSKAALGKRILAGVIDLTICFFFYPLYLIFESPSLFIGPAVYALLKDSLFSGRSVGKFFAGLRVLHVITSRPCTPTQSVIRNILLVIPGVNIVGMFYEIALILKDKNGIRIGDRLAKTQVVEGKEAPELAKLIQDLLLYYGDIIDNEVHQKKGKQVEPADTSNAPMKTEALTISKSDVRDFCGKAQQQGN
jgi:uncharacterized RDD family membrane protein YckC